MAYSSFARRTHGDFYVFIAVEGISEIGGAATNYAIGGVLWSSQTMDSSVAAAKYRACLPELPTFPSQSVPLQGGGEDYGSASFLLSDRDGYFTSLFANGKTANRTRVATDVNATGTGNFVCNGGNDDDFAVGGGSIYCGAETINTTAWNAGTHTFTIPVGGRGYLASPAQPHKQWSEVTDYPVNWYGRLVSIYGAYRDGVVSGASGGDFYCLFRGPIRSIKLDSTGMNWLVSAASLIAIVDTDVCVPVELDTTDTVSGGTAKLAGAMGPEAGTFTVAAGTQGIVARSWVRIGKEVMYVSAINATNDRLFTTTARAKFDTTAEEHKEQEQVAELFVADAGPVITEGSFWRLEAGADVATDHPLDILLGILTSTGSAVGRGSTITVGTNGDYDYLPKWAGLGIDEDFIDIAGIEALRFTLFAGFRMQGYLWLWDHEPTNVLETAVKELLEPLGCILTLADGKLKVVLPKPALPGATSTTVGASVVCVDPVPTMTQGLENTVNKAAIYHHYNYATGHYHELIIDRDWQSFQRVPNNGKTITYRIKATGNDGAMAGKWGDHIMAVMRAFIPPPCTLEVTLPWSYHNIQPGDVVSYSDTVTPNLRTGTRGYASELMQVVSVTRNSKGNPPNVTLSLIWRRGTTRNGRVGPAAKIVSLAAGPPAVYTVSANEFTASELGHTDVDMFDVGDVCMPLCGFLHGGFSDTRYYLMPLDTTMRAVTAKGVNTLTFAAAWAGTHGAGSAPTAGDYIVHGNWAQVGAGMTAHMEQHVFFADTDERIGADPDPAFCFYMV